MSKTQRRAARNRLKRTRLDLYCRESGTNWPSGSFLESFQRDIAYLSGTRRVKWKTLQQLDQRLPSMRLRLRLDNLVQRALRRVDGAAKETLERAKPLINWLVKIDHPQLKELEALNPNIAVEVRKHRRSNRRAKQDKEREAARLRKQRQRKKLRQNDVTDLFQILSDFASFYFLLGRFCLFCNGQT